MKVPDVSGWQGKIDYGKMASRGITKVYVRCTLGSDGQDTFYPANVAGFKSVGILPVPYHYNKAAQSAAAQLKNFLKHGMKEIIDAKEALHDVEDQTSVPADYAPRVLDFLVGLETETGVRAMNYTRSSYWKLYLPKAYNWVHYYRMHIAHYKDSIGPSMFMPFAPDEWDTWQYTDREDGIFYGVSSKQIDMSITNPHYQPWLPEVDTPGLVFLSVLPLQGTPPVPTLLDVFKETIAGRRMNLRGIVR